MNKLESVRTVTMFNLPSARVSVLPYQFTFNGTEQRPAVQVVSKSGVSLSNDSFSSAFPASSVDVGSYEVSLTGYEDGSRSQYVTGSAKAGYAIGKAKRAATIQMDTSTCNVGSVVYAGLSENPDSAVTWNVVEGADLCTTAMNGTSFEITTTGTGTIKLQASIEGTSNYEAYTAPSKTLSVKPAGAELFRFEGLEDQTFTGLPLKPAFSVFFGDKKLVEGADYTVELKDNVNVGEATVTVTGKGDYEGSVDTWFKILPAPINQANFAEASYGGGQPTLKSLVYTGKAQTSSVGQGSFNNGAYALTEDVDYLVSYSEYVNAGTVEVTISGVGNFQGSQKMSYEIRPADIGAIEGLAIVPLSMFEYAGGPITPQPAVTLHGAELKEGVDYTVSYANNTNVGTGQVIITGKGNFVEGSSTGASFEIGKAMLTLTPTAGLTKYAGAPDPEFTYTVSGAKGADVPVIKAGGVLSRAEGEDPGQYGLSMGTVELDPDVPVNANYDLRMSQDPVNFTIEQFKAPDVVATIEGEMGDDGWYYHVPAKLVAPNGYKVSLTNNADESSWGDTVELPDGDASSLGKTYYLRQTTGDKLILEPKTATYKQDTKAPAGRVVVNGSAVWQKLVTPIKFDRFFNQDLKVSLYADDEVSGERATAYHFSEVELTEDMLRALPDSAWSAAEGDMIETEVTAEQNYIVYGRFRDIAGNVGYASSGGMVLDKTPPELTVTYDQDGTWTADKDASVNVVAKDPLAGLKERYVDFRYKMGSNETDVQLLDLDSEGKTVIRNLREGDSTLVVSAQDNAGNVVERTVNVKKDTQDPTLEVSGNLVEYEQYKDVSLVAKVGPSGVDAFEMQKRAYGDPVDESGAWTDITADYNGSQAFRAEENGTYHFRYKNRAGVYSNVASISFDTIDNTKPSVELSASFDDGSAYRGGWTNRNVVVSLKNASANLGTTVFEYRMKDGDSWTTYEGDNASTVKVEVNRPGAWTLQFRITSASGMKSDIREYEVKLDKVNPAGQIATGTNEWTSLLNTLTFGLFFKESKTFTVSMQDAQSGPGRAQYLLVDGANAETLVDEASIEEFAARMGGWQGGASATATAQADPNKRYVLYAKVIDKAGNYSYLSTDGFIMDDQAPIIALGNLDALLDAEDEAGTKWSTSPDAKLDVTVLDSLSGAKSLSFAVDGGTVESVDLSESNSASLDLAEGVHTIALTATDNAGNQATLTQAIHRDSTAPEVRLDGDTENMALHQHVGIEPVVGASGLKKVERQFVEAGADGDAVAWEDVTATYIDGFDVGVNGTLSVRMEDKLGRTAESSLVFENIRYVDPVAVIKAVDVEGAELRGAGWKPQARILVANDPANVAGFTYEYQVDGGGWVTADDADVVDGVLGFAALEGEHTYEARVTNNGDAAHGKPARTSEPVSLTIKVDDTLPEGALVASSADGAELFAVEDVQAGSAYDAADGFAVSVRGLADAEGSSGLAGASYCVYESDEGKPLGSHPVTMDEIKRVFENRWKPLAADQLDAIAAGESVQVLEVQQRHQYAIYLRIRDNAGNTSYVAAPLLTVDDAAPTLSTRYDGSWLTVERQSVTVSVRDELSAVDSGAYRITTQTGEVKDPVAFDFDENGSFALPASELPAGVSTVEVSASDRCGNLAEPLTFEVAVDLVKPEVSALGDTEATAGQPLVTLDVTVGASDVQKVEVEKVVEGPGPQTGSLPSATVVPSATGLTEKQDITGDYQSGYRVPENGRYSFTVTNGAGVASEASTLAFSYLETLPVPVIKAYAGSVDEVYLPDEYTDQTVLLQVLNATSNMGTSLYEYSSDGGATWNVILPVQNEYWLKLEDTGVYELSFRITSQLGAVSHVVKYQVMIDKDQPSFTYELDPGDDSLTNQPVKLSVTGASTSDLEYSYDGGKTYVDQPYAYVHSNGVVRVAVRNQAHRTVRQHVDVENLDMLEPQIDVVTHETKDGLEAFTLEAADAPATADYTSSGMDAVFLTKTDPYRTGTLRTAPDESDVVLSETEDGRYEGAIDMDSVLNTGGDNVWAVAVDAVGNAAAYSVRYKPPAPPVDPDDPDNPDDPNDPDNPDDPNDPDNPDHPNGGSGDDPTTPGGSGNGGGSGGEGGGDGASGSGGAGGSGSFPANGDVPGSGVDGDSGYAGFVVPGEGDSDGGSSAGGGSGDTAASGSEKAAEAAKDAEVAKQDEKAQALLERKENRVGIASPMDLAQEIQMLEELLAGDLSAEQRAKVEAALAELNMQYWGTVAVLWLIFLLVCAGEVALLGYLIRKKRKDAKDLETDALSASA